MELGLATPTKRRFGVKTSVQVMKVNRVVNRLRLVVEPVIAQVKCWRALHSGFRRPLAVYGRVFSSDAWVGVLAAGYPL